MTKERVSSWSGFEIDYDLLRLVRIFRAGELVDQEGHAAGEECGGGVVPEIAAIHDRRGRENRAEDEVRPECAAEALFKIEPLRSVSRSLDGEAAALHFAGNDQFCRRRSCRLDFAGAGDRGRGTIRSGVDEDRVAGAVHHGSASGQENSEKSEKSNGSHNFTCFTSSISRYDLRKLIVSASSGESTVITAIAFPPVSLRARLYSAMLISRSPRSVPTLPTTPGTSLLMM